MYLLSDAELTPDLKVKLSSLLSNIKSTFAESLKKHRDVHVNISKLKKHIDKVCRFCFKISKFLKAFLEDVTSVASYFSTEHANVPTNDVSFDSSPASDLYKTADSMSEDELFAAIIIEELIRTGYGSVAVRLAQVGFLQLEGSFVPSCS